MSEREMHQQAAMQAIHRLLQRVQWKPHKDTQHLAKRKAMGMAWLVIFDRDGIRETAFPPDDLVTYLEKRGFVLLGKMQEITHE